MTGLLDIPLGAKGSGRARYARAMILHRDNQITFAQLEAYRVAAADDSLGPAPTFADRALPLPVLPAPAPAAVILALIDEADRYLATLPGPGVAEVRAGIARHRFGPVLPTAPGISQVVDQHLPQAVAALDLSHPALSACLLAAAPLLNWTAYVGYDPARIGSDFLAGNAYATLIGPQAPIAAQGFELGLFVIAPQVLYRDHHHAAPELYAPLTGPHGWRFGPGRPLVIKPAHSPVWNPPHHPHLTKVGPVPFLCLWGWTRDIREPAQVLPASDWPELERLRLDV